METSPAFSEGKSECRVRIFLESGFCTGPSPGPSPSPVRVSQYAVSDMASEQQGSHSSGQSEEIIELQPQDKQKSDSPDLANTLVELNQIISHMGMMLGDLWQKSQDKTLPSQQTAVDESQHRRKGKKRSRSSSSSSESSSTSEDDSQNDNDSRNKKHKQKTRHQSSETVEADRMSVHVQDDDDNVSLLLHGAKTDHANSPDETLKNLAEMLEENETTCKDIIPRLATLAENRNKKLAPEKLKLIHDKYKRPGNCTTMCQMTVNPEIFAQLPYYQQRADLNVSKIQDSVRKTALITLQSAQTVTNTKSGEFDAVKKQLLEQQVDSLALVGHISYELSCLRRYKIKSVLKPEYAAICVDDGTQSNYLFGDDLPKRLKDAKEASNVGLAINKSHSRSNNYRLQKRHDKRYGEQTNYSGSNSSKPDFRRGKPYHKWKKPRKQQQPPRKK